MCEIFEMSYFQIVRAFDLLSKLRAMAKYQLSSDKHSHKVDTKFVYKLPQSDSKNSFKKMIFQFVVILRHNFGPNIATSIVSFFFGIYLLLDQSTL